MNVMQSMLSLSKDLAARIDRFTSRLPSLPFSRWFAPRTQHDQFAEFLPDTEGIVATRHSPAAGYLILTIATMVSAALLWAGFTEVEQVVRAKARVEPTGRVKIVNLAHGGRVANILIREGEHVIAGQPLLAFDAELGTAELYDLISRWQIEAAEADRLRAEAMDEPLVFAEALAKSRPDLILQQTDLLKTRRQSRGNRRHVLSQAIERQGHQVESLVAETARLENSENILDHQV